MENQKEQIELIKEVINNYDEDLEIQTFIAFKDIRRIVFDYENYVKNKCIKKLK